MGKRIVLTSMLGLLSSLPAAAQCGEEVVVRPGDTLGGIAARCATTVAALVRANPSIDDPDVIHVGDRIAMPAAVARAARIEIGPVAGPSGTTVRVVGVLFPPSREIVIGAGPPQSEYEVIARTRSDARGRIDARVQVPARASRWGEVVFVAATPDARIKAGSIPFDVVSSEERQEPGQRVAVTGTVTGEGVECPQIEAADGRRFTLAGAATRSLQKGDRVSVEGTIAEISFCMQGTTIAVDRLAYVDPPAVR